MNTRYPWCTGPVNGEHFGKSLTADIGIEVEFTLPEPRTRKQRCKFVFHGYGGLISMLVCPCKSWIWAIWADGSTCSKRMFWYHLGLFVCRRVLCVGEAFRSRNSSVWLAVQGVTSPAQKEPDTWMEIQHAHFMRYVLALLLSEHRLQGGWWFENWNWHTPRVVEVVLLVCVVLFDAIRVQFSHGRHVSAQQWYPRGWNRMLVGWQR